MIILIVYGELLFTKMIYRKNTQKASQILVSDLLYDEDTIALDGTDFKFAINPQSSSGIDFISDHSYLIVSVFQVSTQSEIGGGFTETSTEVAMST